MSPSISTAICSESVEDWTEIVSDTADCNYVRSIGTKG